MPDAAHADDLAGACGVLELLERMMVAGQRAPVPPLTSWRIIAFRVINASCATARQILERNDERRVGDDPELAVDLIGALGEDPHAGRAP